MARKVDVKQTSGVDDEQLSIQCLCGFGEVGWTFIIDIDSDDPIACPVCGRKYYFSVHPEVYLVE